MVAEVTRRAGKHSIKCQTNTTTVGGSLPHSPAALHVALPPRAGVGAKDERGVVRAGGHDGAVAARIPANEPQIHEAETTAATTAAMVWYHQT